MIPKEKRGRIMGTIGTLNVLASIPAAALAGFLYGVDPVYPFMFTVVLGVVVCLIIVLLVEEPKVREV